MIDITLLKWATPRQVQFVAKVNELGSYRAAAKALGVHHDIVRKSMRSLKRVAESRGYSPENDMHHVCPDSFIVKDVSTYYNREGTPTGQWVKTRLDEQRHLEAVKEAVQRFIEDLPALDLPAPPTDFDTDIIPWIQIGDAHLGMLAHEAETGENFDLKIAERELCAAISVLIKECGPHERCVINDLGDFTHYENFVAKTEASGHDLDFDGRFPKMIRTYSRIMRFIVNEALKQFKYVDVIVNQGNHSRTNDVWMAELLRVAYCDSGRVTVLNNDNVFIGYRMGKTFVLTHHSDRCKPQRLAHVMATDFATDWGEAEYRYIDIGHIHHNMVLKEHPGVTVESWNQLAPSDQWAHDLGYRSRQSISVVYRSRTYGDVGRKVLPIKRVRDLILTAMPNSFMRQMPRRAFAA